MTPTFPHQFVRPADVQNRQPPQQQHQVPTTSTAGITTNSLNKVPDFFATYIEDNKDPFLIFGHFMLFFL